MDTQHPPPLNSCMQNAHLHTHNYAFTTYTHTQGQPHQPLPTLPTPSLLSWGRVAREQKHSDLIPHPPEEQERGFIDKLGLASPVISSSMGCLPILCAVCGTRLIMVPPIPDTPGRMCLCSLLHRSLQPGSVWAILMLSIPTASPQSAP